VTTDNGTKILTPSDMLEAISDPEPASPSEWDSYEVTLKWLSPILGTTPADSEVLVKWRELAKKGKETGDRDAITVLDINEEKGTVKEVAIEEGVQVELSDDKQGHTAFWKRKDGSPCVMSYQMRGFLNNAVTVLKEDFKFPGRQAGKNADAIRVVRNNVQILPFSVPVADKIDGVFGRTVRAMTMSGPRISINVSEVVLKPKASVFTVRIRQASGITQKHLEHLLEYGLVEGISQWRSGGWGRFSANVRKVDVG